MKNVTDEYKQMITAFAADFDLALDGSRPIAELQKIIDAKKDYMVKDIDLLNKLDYLIRHDKIRILEMS